MKKGSIFLRRALYSLALILAVIILNFLMIQLAPGDPVDVLAGELGGADADFLNQLREEYGLNEPVAKQLLRYMVKMAQFDLGFSFQYNQPVIDLILDRLGATILLVVVAILTSILVGSVLGVLASIKPNGILAGFVSVFSVVGFSAPIFWTGVVLIVLFASVFPIFPISGMADRSLRGEPFLVVAVDVLHHLVLPAITLASVYIAQYARLTRASMLEVLGADYIRTARAKGLRERRVFFRHALRNALMPVITMAGLQFGNIISGAILVETVFNWPGLGTLIFEAVLGRDYTLLLGILFISTLLVIVVNLATDVVYRIADPRLRGKV